MAALLQPTVSSQPADFGVEVNWLIQVALAIYKETRSFPREEVFGLSSQLRRAAVSNASNIVEGSARFSEPEYIHFLDAPYGSAREVGQRQSFLSPIARNARKPEWPLV